MKIENWNTLEEQGFRKTKTGYRKGNTIYRVKYCKECGEKFLGKKQNILCSNSCSKKYTLKDPNSIYNTKEYREKQSKIKKKIWSDKNSVYNTKEYREKLSIVNKGKERTIETKDKISKSMKEYWKDSNCIYKLFGWKEKQSTSKKILWENPNSIYNTKEYREKLSKSASITTKNQWNDPNSVLNSIECRKKMAESHKNRYRDKGIPIYSTYASQLEWCDEIRRSPKDENILETRCTYCGKWMIPKIYSVSNRVQYLKGNYNGENRLYCSTNCKQACPIYNKSPEQLMKEDAIRAGRLGWLELNREVQPELRKLVLERDGYRCVKCNSEGPLHCHHILPVAVEPLESADMDNCITLCVGCHISSHKQNGCRYNELRMEIC